MNAFLASFAMGVAVAAPIGPVGMLCIQRTLRGGLPLGLASGLGVATADGLYATLAAAGIAAVSTLAEAAGPWMRGIGGIALVVLAWRAWAGAAEGCQAAKSPSVASLAAAYGSAFGLTAANPATIVSFAAIISGLGAAAARPSAGLEFVAGIALGSLSWWVTLVVIIDRARDRAPAVVVVWAGKISAIVLGLAGVAALGSLVFL